MATKSEKPRLIDEIPKPAQEKTIKVLCLGAPRTSTSSMTGAMKKLGYKCYEGMGHAFKYENVYPLWNEALDAKYKGIGKPFTAEDFDKILGGYEMVCSWPSILFVDELLAAYPDAKVILTNRDVDKWLESVNDTIHWLETWNSSWDRITPLEQGRARGFRQCANRCSAIWHLEEHWDPEKAREHYLQHYEYVRKVVPKDKLLEHRPTDGWGPLCAFLGKDVPDEPYPHIADRAQFRSVMHFMWWRTFAIAAFKVLLGSSIIFWGASLFRRKIRFWK